jgi:hypothetical protein
MLNEIVALLAERVITYAIHLKRTGKWRFLRASL